MIAAFRVSEQSVQSDCSQQGNMVVAEPSGNRHGHGAEASGTASGKPVGR